MTYNSVDQYLRALKTALSGAPTGLVADALADCEEHLRGALAAIGDADLVEIAHEVAVTTGQRTRQ